MTQNQFLSFCEQDTTFIIFMKTGSNQFPRSCKQTKDSFFVIYLSGLQIVGIASYVGNIRYAIFFTWNPSKHLCRSPRPLLDFNPQHNVFHCSTEWLHDKRERSSALWSGFRSSQLLRSWVDGLNFETRTRFIPD